MTRPITLFTGQWADLPFEEVCRLASSWGYDGLEIACWGDHFEVDRAAAEDDYVAGQREILERHGLGVWAISNHLVGQAVCDDPIDAAAPRHPARVGLGRRRPRGRAAAGRRADGGHRPGGARSSASTPSSGSPDRRSGSTWRCSRPSPPDHSRPATRTSPTAGTRSSTSTTRSACGSPTRCTRARSRTTTGPRCAPWRPSATGPAFGLNWDPSHMVWQDLDPAGFIWDFQDRIYHVDCKDAEAGRQRPQRPAVLAPALGRPPPRLGLRLHRPRRRAVGGLLPHARYDRLLRPDLGRVGGRRDGPARRRGRGGGVRAAARVRAAGAAFDAAFSNQG